MPLSCKILGKSLTGKLISVNYHMLTGKVQKEIFAKIFLFHKKATSRGTFSTLLTWFTFINSYLVFGKE